MRSERLLTLAATLAFLPGLLSAQSGNPIATFSTYIGGSGSENIRGVIPDTDQEVYPARYTDSRTRMALGPKCWSGREGEIWGIVYARVTEIRDTAIVLKLSVSGTAAYGEDHLLTDTTITIDSGQYSVLIEAPVIDDDLAEGIEYIEISAEVLSGPGYFDGEDVVRTWIHDNDSPSRNLLIDPGFEENAGAWQKTTDGGRSIDTLHARSGRHGLRMIASDEFPREVYQDVPVTPGMLYLVAGYYRDDRIDYDSSVAEVVWLDTSGEVIGRDGFYSARGASSPIGWAYSSNCVAAPDGAVTGRYRLSIGVEEDGEGELWFDDIGFYRADGTVGVEEREEPLPSRIDLR